MEHEGATVLQLVPSEPSPANTPAKSLEARDYLPGIIRSDRSLGYIGIPARYREYLRRPIDGNTEAVATAKAAVTNGRSVTIIGDVGRGKTHLAVKLLMKWHEANTEAEIDQVYVDALSTGNPEGLQLVDYFHISQPQSRFCRAKDFFATIQAAYNSNALEASALAEFTQPDMLCLDDIGSEKQSEWTRGMLYELVDRRYVSLRPLILTTNLSLEGLSTIDDRIASRLMEMGPVVQMRGPDRRLPA